MAEATSKRVVGESAANKKDKKSGEKVDTVPPIDEEEYQLRKRLPRKLPKRKNDIYINMQSNFKGQLERAQRMLDAGSNEVFIHGLGHAINRAINIALQLKARGLGTIEVSTNTSTVELIDDLYPEKDDVSSEVQSRNNSAVHIRVFRLSS
ncbi:ribonuclease P protein subunit p20-like [Branchiostoma floridae]|uniref:Ribonuclease P protein subunit p20 n=2 Tax=Branchiostoma floridae TaxID=7739 RepID=A0A9J7M0U6_BRAFL|nr:ribonuclease P protein subunit p20-like [Branchiostoma floridae]